MRYGTSHFVSEYAALRYYRDQGNDVSVAWVTASVAAGTISIGRPSAPIGAKVTVIPGEGRYQIEEAEEVFPPFGSDIGGKE